MLPSGGRDRAFRGSGRTPFGTRREIVGRRPHCAPTNKRRFLLNPAWPVRVYRVGVEWPKSCFLPLGCKFSALAFDVLPIRVFHLADRRIKGRLKVFVYLKAQRPLAVTADHVLDQVAGGDEASSLDLGSDPLPQSRRKRDAYRRSHTGIVSREVLVLKLPVITGGVQRPSPGATMLPATQRLRAASTLGPWIRRIQGTQTFV